jgi:tyrosinase
MRVRNNVAHLSPAAKAAFVAAVLALKQKPSVLNPGGAGWRRYDDFAQVHMNAMMAMPGWAHTRPAFFPWHREMLLQFENELVAIDPSVTLPYWDWTDPASNPFTADFLGGDGDPAQNDKVTTGPFAFDGPNHWRLVSKDDPGDPNFLARSFGTDPTAMSLPTVADVNAVLSVTPYDSSPWSGGSAGFRSSLEFALHNLVHRYIGGTMGVMTSPNDPVFWLHHCNIDRLWADWMVLHPGASPYLPVSGAADPGQNLTAAMIFNDTPPAPWAMGATPASVINHHALGYRYDNEWTIALPHPPLSFVRVLFGLINDAPGVVIGPDGKPHPVPGWPGDPWRTLSAAERNELVAVAIVQIAAMLEDRGVTQSIERAVMPHIGARLQRELGHQ